MTRTNTKEKFRKFKKKNMKIERRSVVRRKMLD